jgi:hypothetical protein
MKVKVSKLLSEKGHTFYLIVSSAPQDDKMLMTAFQ